MRLHRGTEREEKGLAGPALGPQGRPQGLTGALEPQAVL